MCLSWQHKKDSECKSLHAFIDEQMLCIKEDRGIFILSAEGKETGRFAEEIKKPITLHSGSQIVAILEKNLLHAYTHAGNKIYSIGRYGSAPGAFDGAKYVFSAHNKVYVGDEGNHRIQIFAGDGQFVDQVKASDKSFGKLGPFAVDERQQLYVADEDSRGFDQGSGC